MKPMLSGREFDVRGMRELQSTLADLDDKVRRQFLTRAAKAGGNVFLAGAIKRAPVGFSGARLGVAQRSGALKDSMILRIKTKASQGTITAVVGPARFKGEDNQAPGAYGLMVEVGTKPHIIKPKNARVLFDSKNRIYLGNVVHHPGAKAKPYLKPTFTEDKDAAYNAFAAQLQKDLEEFRARS